MTSLAQQLQRLAVPQTQAIFGQLRKKCSLLFDPKEAAELDKETFYALGISGLEELENIDSSFDQFELSLFGESSLTFERSIQTQEVNQKLDITISKLLRKLSPYFLLKPAHKVFEWLIYRYSVHLYNVDEYMMCILPSHESKIFVRAVQLISFNKDTASKWGWLESLKISGVHLTRSSLIYQCSKNVSLLSFICEMVPKYIKTFSSDGTSCKELRVLFSFFASTVVGVLQNRKVSESLIAALIPHISRGLKSSVVDYRASSLIVVAQLFCTAKLEEKLLQTFLKILTKQLTSGLMRESMACICLIYKTQDIRTFPRKAIKYLAKVPYAAIYLKDFISQQDSKLVWSVLEELVGIAVQKSLTGFCSESASSTSDEEQESYGSPQFTTLLRNIVMEVPLDNSTAKKFTKKCLIHYITNAAEGDSNEVENLNEMMREIIKILERRYQDAMDRAVTECLTEHEGSKSLIKNFLDLTLSSSKHKIIPDSDTNLVLSLHHRTPAMRQSAISYILQNVNKMEDHVFVEDAILQRLKDDDYDVVEVILNAKKTLWDILSARQNDLINSLMDLLLKVERNSKWERLTLLFEVLGSCPADCVSELEPIMLTYIYSSDVRKSVQVVLKKSDAVSKSVLLKGLIDGLDLTGSSDKNMQQHILKRFLNNLQKLNWDEMFRQVEKFVQACDDQPVRKPILREIMLVVLKTLTENDSTFKYCLLLLHLVKRTGQKETTEGMDEQTEAYPVKLIGEVLTSLIKNIRIPTSVFKDAEFLELNEDDVGGWNCLKTLIKLLDFLLGMISAGNSYFQNLLLQYFEVIFKDHESLLKFYGLIWSPNDSKWSERLEITSVLQARTLKLGYMHMQLFGKRDLTSALDTTSSAVLSLLFCLSNKNRGIREWSLKCFKHFHELTDGQNLLFTPLVNKIVRCEEEIFTDADFIYQVVALTLRKEAKKSPKKRARKSYGTDSGVVFLKTITDLVIADGTPLYIKNSLLEILKSYENEEMFIGTLKYLHQLVSKLSSGVVKLERQCLELLIHRYQVSSACLLHQNSTGLELFIQVMKYHQDTNLQELAIDRIDKDFYDALPDSPSQHQLLSALFDVWMKSRTLSVTNLIRKKLKHISIDAVHLISDLEIVISKSSTVTVREVKKVKRQSGIEKRKEEIDFSGTEWERISVILEAIQSKKKIQNYEKLIPVLFKLLSCILEAENHNSGEYIKQLILESLCNISTRTVKDMIDEKPLEELDIQVELIVQCIRTSDNPQTHHQSLMFLTIAAQICPENLLHNVMPVFSFMGANILRQDDSYSFHVISQILEFVVPALTKACKERKRFPAGVTNDINDVITMVLRVFVDAYPHIPVHRQLMLFTKLISIVGEKDYLWRCLLLFTDYIVNKGQIRAVLGVDTFTNTLEHILPTDLEFMVKLCIHFSPDVHMIAAKEMIDYIASLPDDKEESEVRSKQMAQSLGNLTKKDSDLFDLETHTAKQLRHFKFTAVHFLYCLFSSEDFLSKVIKMDEEKFLLQTKNVLETLLEYIEKLTKSVDDYLQKPTAKFWKRFQHKVYDLLDKVTSLLPMRSFVIIVSGLLNHELFYVQRKAMELLASRIQQQKDTVIEDEKLMLDVVGVLTNIVEVSTHRDRNEQTDINGQTALFTLKVICRYFGNKHTEVFVKVLSDVVRVLNARLDSPMITACALLCVGELCSSTKVHAIPHISSFMPTFVKLLQDVDKLLRNEMILMSVITSTHKLLETLPYFISPYLLDILTQICILSSISTEDALEKPPIQLTIRLKSIRTVLSSVLPTRTILPAIISAYGTLIEDEKKAIPSLMSVLREHISDNKEDFPSHINNMVTFFLTCLDFRIVCPEEKEKIIFELEGCVIDTVITMIMKMSESTFRPVLFKIFEWATTSDTKKERILVLYRMADSLAEKLRNLFTLFAGYLVNHASKMLDDNNNSKTEVLTFGRKKKSKKKSCKLLIYIMDCLHKCFLYDTEGFMNTERFNLLMQPLTDQIENTLSNKKYRRMINDHLVPCIAKFATSVQDDVLWKSLNYQILLKTRNPSREVRLSALEVLLELHKVLGKEYMSILPETIPFLAELMEDDDDTVEKRCLEVITEMERTLGEPLQKYF